MALTIHRETDAIDGAIEAIRAGLRNWNRSAVPIEGSEQVVLTIKDPDDDALIAGLVAWMWGEAAELEFLWVADHRQREGLGSRLLEELESIARQCGCKVLHTFTFTFQAPGFYEKHGFEQRAELDGFPDGIAKQYFRKEL